MLFNDDKDVEVSVMLEGSFVAKNCCAIAYRKLEVKEEQVIEALLQEAAKIREQALEIGKRAHQRRPLTWYIRKEVPEVAATRDLWKKIHLLQQEAFYKEKDPFLKKILFSEALWAAAEEATWSARATNTKANVSQSKASEKHALGQADLEYQEARERWHQAIQAKEEVLKNTNEEHLVVLIKNEIAWAKAEEITRVSQAAYCRVWLQDFKSEERAAFDTAWDANAHAMKPLVQAWEEAAKACHSALEGGDLSQEEQTLWQERLQEAHYWKNYYQVEPLYDEAVKSFFYTDFLKKEALKIKPSEEAAFKAAWEAAAQAKEKERQLFENAFKAYEEIYKKESFAESWKEIWEEHFNKASYWGSDIPSSYQNITKVEKIAEATYAAAEEISSDDPIFEAVWAEATQKRKEVADTWKEAEQILRGEVEKRPAEKQEPWASELAKAQYQAAYQNVRTLCLETKKREKIAKEAELQALEPLNQEATSDVIQKNKAIVLAWNHVIEAYKNYREFLPKEKQADWDKRLREAKNDKAKLPRALALSQPWSKLGSTEFNTNVSWQNELYPLWLRLYQAEKNADIASSKIEILDPKEFISFDQGYEEAIGKRKDSATAWAALRDGFHKEKKNIFPEQEWSDDLAIIQYEHACQSIKAILLEAEKIEKVAQAVESHAMEQTHKDETVQKAAWDEEKSAAAKLQEVWERVINAYTEYRESIPVEKRPDWDEEYEEALYQKARMETASLWINALSIRQVAEEAGKKLKIVKIRQQGLFEEEWNSCNEKEKAAEAAWGEVVTCYDKLKKVTIPKTQIKKWEENSYRAMHTKALHSLELLQLEALKLERKARATELAITNYKYLNPKDVVGITKIQGDAIRDIALATQAWGDACRFCQKMQEQLPNTFKEDWEILLKKAQANHDSGSSRMKRLKLGESDKERLGERPDSIETYLRTFREGFPRFQTLMEDFSKLNPEEESTFFSSEKEDFQDEKFIFTQQEQSGLDFNTEQRSTDISKSLLLAEVDSFHPSELAAASEAKATYFSAVDQALTISPQEKISFNQIWNEVTQKIEAATAAFDKLITAYSNDQLRYEALNEIEKKAWEYQLNDAKYWRALFVADPFWVKAKQADQKADLAKSRAIKATSEIDSLRIVWEEALQEVEAASNAWDAVAKAYKEGISEAPGNDIAESRSHILSALDKKNYHHMNALFIKAKQASLLADTASKKLERSHSSSQTLEQERVDALQKKQAEQSAWKAVKVGILNIHTAVEDHKNCWNELQKLLLEGLFSYHQKNIVDLASTNENKTQKTSPTTKFSIALPMEYNEAVKPLEQISKNNVSFHHPSEIEAQELTPRTDTAQETSSLLKSPSNSSLSSEGRPRSSTLSSDLNLGSIISHSKFSKSSSNISLSSNLMTGEDGSTDSERSSLSSYKPNLGEGINTHEEFFSPAESSADLKNLQARIKASYEEAKPVWDKFIEESRNFTLCLDSKTVRGASNVARRALIYLKNLHKIADKHKYDQLDHDHVNIIEFAFFALDHAIHLIPNEEMPHTSYQSFLDKDSFVDKKELRQAIDNANDAIKAQATLTVKATPFSKELQEVADLAKNTAEFAQALYDFKRGAAKNKNDFAEAAKQKNNLDPIIEGNESESQNSNKTHVTETIKEKSNVTDEGGEELQKVAAAPIPFTLVTGFIKKHPVAKRVVIQEKDGKLCLEAPRFWNPIRLLSSNRSSKIQNQQVEDVLKAALIKEYGVSVVNQLIWPVDYSVDWSAARIEQMIQAADEINEPTVAQASEKELREFYGARVIAQGEMIDPNDGKTKNVRILKTKLDTPYIRIEQEITQEGLRNELQMIADHLLVESSEEKNITDFYYQLEKLLLLEGITIEQIIDKHDSFYELHFKPSVETLPKVLFALRKLGGTSAPDFIMSEMCSLPKKDPYYKKQWNLHGVCGIKAPEAWALFSSINEPISVAIFDTGICQHNDLDIKLEQPHRNFLVSGLESKLALEDTHSHGTHIAGIIGAIRNNGIGIAGITDHVQLISCKISEDGKMVRTDLVKRAMKHAYSKGARIYNGSFSDKLISDNNNINATYSEYPLKEILKELKNESLTGSFKKAIFVVAAGNDGRDIDSSTPYPARLAYHEVRRPNGAKNVVVVAATDKIGQLATFIDGASNYGKETVHLGAPGCSIWSTVPEKNEWLRVLLGENAYSQKGGTSMAVPHVVAALALMERAFPDANSEDLIQRLLATTDKLPSLQGKCISSGLLNLAHALRKDLVGKFGVISNVRLFSPEWCSWVSSLDAMHCRTRAEQSMIGAELAKNNAVVAQQTADVATSTFWNRAILKAESARDIWLQTKNKFQRGLESAPSNFDVIQEWWRKELIHAEDEWRTLSSKIEQWKVQRSNSTRCSIM